MAAGEKTGWPIGVVPTDVEIDVVEWTSYLRLMRGKRWLDLPGDVFYDFWMNLDAAIIRNRLSQLARGCNT